ncbi:glutamate racemase [Prochlorococcus marinus XMU1414]|uniref:Glutamate racemase n=1 Tax=Prochlorococcus marinus XMU1424 TaxID=2774497 RepID=A0A9D9G2F5_PROMR|nr:glutamate racemase [Prochlorococcus marinus]MBO8227907.1 glutamate racemase [Prochlorococcus marinus XMU1414]MBW3045420.1 glutamate racemase [Prochlorococcus marinus str. MU1414]MCR8532313.1 glutamate racemase [Prochlorococcus marinus XMU1420]MCR8535841.1 glutamate racemase [Prochlorococcus marinus XMU1424]
MKLKIGIFDSGIGGFTILNSLLKTRKDVEIFYLADTKRIPFGNKNFKEIRLIAKDICTFFVDKNLDALLVACNTTNACALDILKDELKVPCFDLINSVSEIVDKQIIGVLATQTTVRSSYYEKAIIAKKENTIIFQQECPEFVSEIEKEKLNLDKLNSLSDLYLRPLINKNIEELILGCSHYPLIYDFLRKKLDSNIKIIDPSVALIKKFNESFASPKTCCYESISLENVKFFVTSEKDEFSNKVKFWLGINKEIRLVNLRSNV